MTEYLKNNPIALRHCLLYEILQGKWFEKAYIDFCMTVGPKVIEREEFTFWFYKFKAGIFADSEKPFENIVDVLRNNKQALRACVMYEWLTTKKKQLANEALSVFAKYQNFCKVIGDDTMEYPEFESWFHRFDNEEFDINPERDSTKKIYGLSDMPIDIMKNIVDYLDIFDRLSLMKTSRSLRNFIGDQKLFYKELEFMISDQGAQVSTENRCILIKNAGEDCYRWCGRGDSGNGKLIRGVCYWKQALEDLKNTLKLPNLHVEEFHFKMDISEYFGTPSSNVLETFDKAVDSLEVPIQKWNVKKLFLFVYSVKPILKILPYMKPGYLTTFMIRIRKLNKEEMNGVVEMEQWKQATYLKMKLNAFSSPKQHLYNFNEFDVLVDELSDMDMYQMRETLFMSPDFKKCTFRMEYYSNMEYILRAFGDPIPDDESTYHYPIPNSSEYFEIRYYEGTNPDSQQIVITREKK